MKRPAVDRHPFPGAWRPGGSPPQAGVAALRHALHALSRPLHLVDLEGAPAVGPEGEVTLGAAPSEGSFPLLAYVPPLLPDQLGDPAFRAEHGLRYAYIAGAMANGISSEALVEAMARAGMLGFFGAAGLPLERVEAAIDRLQGALGELPFGFNLIHSPNEPDLEAGIVDLYLRRGVCRVSASAYLDLTLPVVRYRVTGIHRDAAGRIVVPNKLFAKVSRIEVARRFLAPPPDRLLRALVEAGQITAAQAALAEQIPMAQDVTAEADSGGHTDNRPLVVLLPALMALRDELHERHHYPTRPRIGAAGGIATPVSAAAAFSMGAAYILTGSINQSCLEAGTSDQVREMLGQAGSTDVAMAPAADMFELGVDVQVLSRGTLFPVRARKLHELYRTYDSLEALPADVRATLEKTFFRTSLEEAWEGCRRFFAVRDPSQIDRAESDPRHRMALVFRSYLGQSSTWANEGVPDRRLDYQVWCGPAMGAFNEWVRGTWLEPWQHRRVVPLALNLLAGAAVQTRVAALRAQGVAVPPEAARFEPVEEPELEARYLTRTVAPTPASASGHTDEYFLTATTSATTGRAHLADAAPAGPSASSTTGAPAASAVSGHTSIEGGAHSPIAVVGIGCLFPRAHDLQSFWRLLRTGIDAVGDVPPTHWSVEDYFDPDPKAPDRTYARRGAFLDPYPFDPTAFGIPPNILEATDTAQLLGLVAARMALEDAGYGEEVAWDRGRASVLLGVTGTQELVISLGARLGHPHWRRALREAGVEDALAEEVVARIGRAYVGWQENSFPGLLGNVVAGRIANRLNLGGTNCVIDAACASSLGAVHLACLELQARRSDLVITGGVDALNDIFMHMCFSKTPALSPTGDARPFSDRADGTILGEGIGMLVLKRLADAERDGDRIYAVIRGIGTSSDGRAKSIYAPLPEGQARALRAAYREAGVRPGEIGLLEAHGTGTKAGDVCEVEALTRVYREDRPEGTWCALGSVKSQIGHTKAAAGAAGIIKAALAVYHKVLPPTLKVDAPNPALELEKSPFYLSIEARPWLAGEGMGPSPRRAAVSAFGFGGSNFHAVVEEHRPDRSHPAWDGSVELLALSAPDAASLVAKLEAAINQPDPDLPARSRAQFRSSDPFRMVIVLEADVTPSDRLARAREQLVRQPGSSWSLPEGVHYGVGAPPGRLAFLFPGQGSQYVGMIRDLATIFPEMLTALEASGPVAGTIHPAHTFDAEVRRQQTAALTRTEVAQPAIGAVSLGLTRVLERFGVRPELVAGHSYGELTALHAAGWMDASSLLRLSRRRGELMAGDGGDRGTMLAVSAPLPTLETMLREEGLEVVLANRNTPAQGVLSGAREAIAKAEAACRSRGLKCQRLEVAAAFHSPLVAGAEAAFRSSLEEIAFTPGRLPVIADSTAEAYPAEVSAARDLLAGQLARPVRFVEVIERLVADGAHTFLEVGPKAVLTGMVRAILGDRAHRAIALDASAGRKAGLLELALALAQIAALGHPVELAAWQQPPPPPRTVAAGVRRPRMVIPLSGANFREPARELPAAVGSRPAPTKAAPAANGAAPAKAVSSADATPAKTVPAANAAPAKTVPAANAAPAKAVPGGMSHATPIPANRTPESPMSRPPYSSPFVEGDVVHVSPAQPTAPASGRTGASAPAGDPTFLLEALRASQESLRAMQGLQEQTASIHRRFLEGQEVAQRGFQTVLEGQQRLIEQVISGGGATGPRPPAPATTTVSQPITSSQLPPLNGHTQAAPPLNGHTHTAPSYHGHTHAVVPPNGTALAAPYTNGQPHTPVSNGTAHAAPSATLPAHTTAAAPARQATAKAIAGIEARAVGPARAPAPRPSIDVEPVLLAVVSEATGYPVDMLGLDMDLESDLGIDSIKRVEILSVLTSRIPEAPSVEPEHLSRLQTLRQVADFIRSAVGIGAGSSPSAVASSSPAATVSRPAGSTTRGPAPVAAAVPSGRPAHGGQTAVPEAEARTMLLTVVSELTGYPLEMLGLEMDLESDLGIDSIKRVEILSVLSERLPGARTVEPEQLSGLNTLEHVLRFIAVRPPEDGVRATSPVPASGTAAIPASGHTGSKTAPAATIAPASTEVCAGLEVQTVEATQLSDEVVLQRRAVTLATLLEPTAPHTALPVAPGASIWLTDDGTPLASALQRRLTDAGHAVRMIRREETHTATGDRPIGALIVLGGGEPSLEAPWSTAGEQRLKEAFSLLRSAGPRLRESGSTAGALLVSITRLGGFGLGRESWARPDIDPVQGGLAGLVKTAAREWPEVRCRALDVAPAWDAEEAASAILEELRRDAPLEVALGPDGRHGITLRTLPVGPATDTLEPGALVVITGGARGVTAACAIALASARPLTLLLLGRTPEPAPEPAWLAGAQSEAEIKRALLDHGFRGARPGPKALGEACQQVFAGREISTTLERLSRTGATVLYRAVDVRDPAAVSTVLEEVRRAHGPVRGIVHGAGVLQDRRIEDKTDEQLALVLDTKLAGLRALLSATAGDDLAFLALFTSVSGRFGRRGQADYAAANEALNRIAQREAARRLSCRVVALNWGPWDGGMVTAGLKREFEREGVGLIPLEAGARQLVAEVLAAPGGPVEVVIGQVLDEHLQPPPPEGEKPDHDPSSRKRADDAPQGAHRPTGAPAAPRLVQPPAGPAARTMGPVLRQRLDPAVHTYLEDHRIGGRPVLPMAMMLEWFAQAAARVFPDARFSGLDDLRLLQGVVLDAGPITLEVHALRPHSTPTGGQVELELRGPSGRVHARAVAHMCVSEFPVPSPMTLNHGDLRPYPEAAAIYGAHLFHGPGLHAIEKVHGISSDGMTVSLRTAPAPRAWQSDGPAAWTTDPLVIDGVFQALILWCRAEQGAPSLPSRIDAYRQYRSFPTGPVRAVVAITGVQGRNVTSDIDLLDAGGHVVARLEGYVCTVAASLEARFREGRDPATRAARVA